MGKPIAKIMVIPLRLHQAEGEIIWQIGVQDGKGFQYSSEVLNLDSLEDLRLLPAHPVSAHRPVSATIQHTFTKLFRCLPRHIFTQPICQPITQPNKTRPQKFLYYPFIILVDSIHHEKLLWICLDEVLTLLKKSARSNTRLTIKHIIEKHLLVDSPQAQTIKRKITGEELPEPSPVAPDLVPTS